MRFNKPRICLFICLLTALTACNSLPQGEAQYPTGADRASTSGDIYAEPESIFGKGGLFNLDRDGDSGSNGGLEVNSYLWRAALDTVSFMPLASADPFGGVILTDWYTDPTAPNERTKLNVFILNRELKADAIKVKAFKQTASKGKNWTDSPVAAGTERKLEDAILTRARQMRVAKEEDGMF